MRFIRQYAWQLLLLTGLVSFSTGISAEEPPPAPEIFDRIWESNRLYSNPDNETIQSFSLIGRYHGQYWSVDARQGEADGWENRRMIFGFNATLFQDFKLEAQIHANEDFSPVYDELYVAFLEWAPRDRDFSLNLGRLDYVFAGLERSTSSKKIATFERSALVNQVMPGEVFGLYGTSDFSGWGVQAGLFTGANTEEFGDFNSGTAATFGLMHEFPLLYDQGTLHVDYLYHDGDKRNTAFGPYQNVVSLWHQGEKGPYTLGLDLTLANDNVEGKSSVWGLTLLPTYDITQNLWVGGDTLQLALRYHYANSAENNGILVPRRYESEVTSGEGERYQAFYAGLNYLLNSHKLKFMAGAEYARLDDAADDGGAYRGWTYLAGIRLYF